MGAVRISDKKIAEVLKETKGNLTATAESLGYTRRNVEKRIAKSKHLKDVLSEARDSFVDMVEGAMQKKIREGDTACIIFALKTRGRDRGWCERVEVDSRIIIENPREVE